MMGTSDFKDAIGKLEKQFSASCSAGGWQEQEVIRKELMTELYLLLHSDMALKYFSAIYRRTGASDLMLGKEIEDYLTELWITACECYDPGKGKLLPFLTTRMQNRIIDDERKMGGLTGLPRARDERAKIRLLGTGCMDSGETSDERFIDENQLVQAEFQMQEDSDTLFEREHGDLLAGDCLHALAKRILVLADGGAILQSGVHRIEEYGTTALRKNGERRFSRYFYYRLFYSSDVLSYLKETGCATAFQHVREEMAALHLPFTNFCTDRRMQYRHQEEITPSSILARPLARNRDVLPHSLLSTVDQDARISIPIQNEVIRGFMERIEGRNVSASNISQMRRKYLDDIRTILNI